ncbi:MAG TPA: hypothetical protein VFO67_04710 [Gemmatimonadales bacterium]|nr:hypothetical protein [Gemmatimonadales bacterium]
MRTSSVLVAVLALLSTSVAAQGPAGRWKTSIDTTRGPFPLIFEFAVKGDKVTGTLSNDFLPKFPIEEGTVKGNQLSFTLRLQTVTLGYLGSFAGDKLTLKSRVVEDRSANGSTGQTLGDMLRPVGVLSATRVK